MALASHGDEIMGVLRVLGEIVVAVLAVKGVAAAAKLLTAFNALAFFFSAVAPAVAEFHDFTCRK